jgi:hypothetical protein
MKPMATAISKVRSHAVVVFPEALNRLRSLLSRDHFIDYCSQGKRSYYIASTFEEPPYEEEAPVLRRLSEDFELCAYGLHQIRLPWERLPGEESPPDLPAVN